MKHPLRPFPLNSDKSKKCCLYLDPKNLVAVDMGKIPAGDMDAVHADHSIFYGGTPVLLAVEMKPMGYNEVILYTNQFCPFECLYRKQYEPRLFLDVTLGDKRYIIPYDKIRKFIERDNYMFSLTYKQIVGDIGIEPLTIQQTQRYLQAQLQQGILPYPDGFNETALSHKAFFPQR